MSTHAKKSCTKVRDFYFLPLTSYLLPLHSYLLPLHSYLFTLTSNGRIFWEVIGKREEVRSEVAFRGGEKQFYFSPFFFFFFEIRVLVKTKRCQSAFSSKGAEMNLSLAFSREIIEKR